MDRTLGSSISSIFEPSTTSNPYPSVLEPRNSSNPSPLVHDPGPTNPSIANFHPSKGFVVDYTNPFISV